MAVSPAEKSFTLVSIFPDREHAQCALEALHEAGLSDEQIGVIMRQPEDSGTADLTTEDRVKVAGKAAAGGAAVGGVIGALVGAATALLLPGIGPVIAGGMLFSVLAGAATGAAAGTVAGALDGFGVPEDEARFAEQEFQAGRVVVTVQAGPVPDPVREIFRKCGGYDIHSQSLAKEEQSVNTARSMTYERLFSSKMKTPVR